MAKDDFFLNDNFYGDEFSTTRTPSNNESDTLRERLNPEKEIMAFKLSLMGAYEAEEDKRDEDGDVRKVKVIKPIKNFKPVLNKQGIEDVTNYLKNLVSSHTFQSNFLDKADYNLTCKFTFNNMLANFIAKRREWAIPPDEKVSLMNIRIVYDKSKNIAKLGLRRALLDAERGHLSDTVKENIQVARGVEKKENILQRAAGILK